MVCVARLVKTIDVVCNITQPHLVLHGRGRVDRPQLASHSAPSDVGYHLSYHDIDEVTTSLNSARGAKSRHKVIVKLSEGINWEVTKQ